MIKFITFFTFERLVILFLVCTGLFFLVTFTSGFVWSWPFMLVMIFLVIRYFLLGSVGAAAQKLQVQDFEGAKKMLGYTYKPSWLRFGMEAMYYFLLSSINQNDKDMDGAEKNLRRSVELGLPDTDSNAMAYMNLAALAFQKNNKRECEEWVKKARKTKTTNTMITDYLDQIEQALKAPKMTMQQQMMMGRGGKGFRQVKR